MITLVANVIVCVLIVALPTGIGLAYWTGDPHWLWLSLASFIFAMAGL